MEDKRKLKKQNNKGITLIALVITIIVMLILAGVSISLVLDENNGIIKRTQVAVNAYDDGRIREEGMLQTISNTFDEYLAKLGQTGGTEGEGETGGSSSQTVYAGKKINYTPAVDTSFTLPTYEGVTFTNAGTESLEWTVLTDYSNGDILITTTTPTTATATLTGAGGYNNGVQALNAYCRKYYSSGTAYARNINIEDVEEHLTPEGIAQKQSTYSEIERTFGDGYIPSGFKLTTQNNVQVGTSESLGDTQYGAFENRNDYASSFNSVQEFDNSGGSVIAKYKDTNYNVNSKNYFDDKVNSSLFNSDKNTVAYWLSSRIDPKEYAMLEDSSDQAFSDLLFCTSWDTCSINSNLEVGIFEPVLLKFSHKTSWPETAESLPEEGGTKAFRPVVRISASDVSNYTFTE